MQEVCLLMFSSKVKTLLALSFSVMVVCGCSWNQYETSDTSGLRPMQPIYIPPEVNRELEAPLVKAAMAPFVSTWLEPIPGQFQKEQGFKLFADGTAQSVNMATLIYQGWRVRDGRLILWGKSIGNGGTSSFDETWDVVMVSKKKLVLKRNGFYKTYRTYSD